MSFRKGIIIASQGFLRFILRPSKSNINGSSDNGEISMHMKKFLSERDTRVNVISSDNGGRRRKEERRQFDYTFHIPERRTGVERRCGEDRRQSNREAEVNL